MLSQLLTAIGFGRRNNFRSADECFPEALVSRKHGSARGQSLATGLWLFVLQISALPRPRTCPRSARQAPSAGSPASPRTPPLPPPQPWPSPGPPWPPRRCAGSDVSMARGRSAMKQASKLADHGEAHSGSHTTDCAAPPTFIGPELEPKARASETRLRTPLHEGACKRRFQLTRGRIFEKNHFRRDELHAEPVGAKRVKARHMPSGLTCSPRGRALLL